MNRPNILLCYVDRKYVTEARFVVAEDAFIESCVHCFTVIYSLCMFDIPGKNVSLSFDILSSSAVL